MFRREDIRYGNPWIRLLCCFALACGYWNLYGFAPVTAVENALFGLLLNNDITWAATASFWTRIAILYAACAAPSVLRVERPFVMLMCGIGFAALYLIAALVVLTMFDLALPLTLPLVGTLSASALLQTMAWSEERSRRRQLERIDAARQQFTDLLVHDLRRRLSSMQASISMLKRTPPDATDRMADLTTTLSASTNRMMIQVSALLDVRKIQEGKMKLNRERVRLRDVLDELLVEYRPASEMVGVAIETATEAPTIDVDRAIFSRVVANLLWNALQHAPPESTIRVESGMAPGGWLDFSVTNDGAPIPLDVQGSLFEAFMSGKPAVNSRYASGSGLGLTFCKLALEVHGGCIRVESPVPGRADGVRVTISLPPSTVLRG